MISMRKAIILASAMCVAVGLTVNTASAQTGQTPVSASINVVNAAGGPATLTGYSVTVSCTSPVPSVAQTAAVSSFGGSGTVFFTVNAANSCTFTLNGLAGTTVFNPGTALVGVSVGGVFLTSLKLGVATAAVPVTAATSVVFTLTYPSLTVRKTVIGTETTAGQAYPMIATCQYNTTPPTPIPAADGKSTFVAFKLKSGEQKVLTIADFPGLVADATCFVAETDNGGARITTIVSTKSDGTTVLGGYFGPTFQADGSVDIPGRNISGPTIANGQTVTISNSFIQLGDLIISKVVTGDPRTAITIYEFKVTCSNNLTETFLMKDRQSKVYTGLPVGTACTVTETRSDGATTVYADNSETPTDGAITIKTTSVGCRDANLATAPDCRANVIVTNSYAAAAPTTAAVAASATTVPVNLPAATLPPVAPAPPAQPEVLDASEATVG
jgi:Domain of unknown function (DUF5979)